MTRELEMEKALERLSESKQRKVAGRIEDHRLIVSSSAMLTAIYEENEAGKKQLTSNGL